MISNLKAALIALALMIATGCEVSMQSKQYNFIKTLFQERAQTPNKNWQIVWQGRSYLVYAVNLEKGSIFLDESGLTLHFDGWNVKKFSVPGPRGIETFVVGKTMEENGNISLRFEDAFKASPVLYSCQPWAPHESKDGEKGWIQSCSGPSGSFLNEILINGSGMLIYLSFVISPGKNPIEVKFG